MSRIIERGPCPKNGDYCEWPPCKTLSHTMLLGFAREEYDGIVELPNLTVDELLEKETVHWVEREENLRRAFEILIDEDRVVEAVGVAVMFRPTMLAINTILGRLPSTVDTYLIARQVIEKTKIYEERTALESLVDTYRMIERSKKE